MALTKEQAEAIRKQLLSQIEKLPKDQIGDLAEQVKGATPEQLEAFIQQAQKQQGGGECIFCQIVAGKIDSVKIYEDAEIMAVLDIMPANDGQLLVFPKQHFQFIQEIPDQLYQKLVMFVKKMSPILVEVLKAQSLSIYIPQGQLAGQRIPHFVINLIPRFQGDKVSMDWERKQRDKKELEKVGKKLREVASKKITFEVAKEVKKEIANKKREVKKETKKIMKHKKKRFP
ncbi:MAG: HIT family protein [archaeon]